MCVALVSSMHTVTVAADVKARLQIAGSFVTVTLGCVHVTGPPLLLYTQYPADIVYLISSPCFSQNVSELPRHSVTIPNI